MKCLLCDQDYQEELKLFKLVTFQLSSDKACPSCLDSFEKIEETSCPNCCRQGRKEQCQDCRVWCQKGYIPRHKALYRYNDSMKNYFSHYKFMGDYLLRRIFQDEISRYLKPYLKKGFTLVPVPLSPERMAERGFNQVTGLLEFLPYSQLFQKNDIAKQSAQGRNTRLTSSNPFSLKETANLPDKILLVDDIYTTGATLHHLVQLLQESGVKAIESFSLAR